MSETSLLSRLSVNVAFIALLTCTSCNRQESLTVESEVLARMNGIEITVSDLEKEVKRLQESGRPVPGQRELLDQVINFNAQVLKARETGIADDPKVKRQIDRLLVSTLREHTLEPGSGQLDEATLKNRYEANLEKYTVPASDRFAILFLALEKSASEEKKNSVMNRMNEARSLAAQSADPSSGFGTLSQTHSDDQLSRYRGGDVGWSRRTEASSRIPQEVWLEGIDLEKGQISSVIKTDDGVYLIKKTDMRPASVTPFEKVKSSILRAALADQRSQAEQDFIATCRASVEVELNEERIAQMNETAPRNVGRNEKILAQESLPGQ